MNIEKMKAEITIRKYETTNLELTVRIAERKVEIARLESTIKENKEKVLELKGASDE